jgi:GntR family transcriptional regulator/MocR family aminotransferase
MAGRSGPLLVEVNRNSGGPLHEQLERRLRAAVRAGRLAPGTKLPSTRALAASLGVSRGVVVEAYSQLVAEGYLVATQGGPTRVASAAVVERPPIPARSLEREHAYDFAPGLPDLGSFPGDGWLRSLRAALREAPFRAFGHDDPRGTVRLRNALMEYLGRVRGAAPEPEHTLACAGFTQGFSLVCRTLRDRGVERIALEDPGWPQHRSIAERAGLEAVPVPVDADGVDVGALRRSGCEAVVVTPAHQYPLGVVMSSGRRADLLEWAEEVDGLIVEDDYNSELRYDRDPVGAVQGLAPERVCHIGSVSARLAPALRLGWVLSPSWLTGALTYEKALSDGGTPAVDQLALADFVERGELDRHLRRMRLRYRERRAALLDAVAVAVGRAPGPVGPLGGTGPLEGTGPPGGTGPARPLGGAPAGLHTLVILPDGADENAVVRAAAARGVGVAGLRAHYADPEAPADPGLVLGYGNLSVPAIRRGVALLAAAVRETRS